MQTEKIKVDFEINGLDLANQFSESYNNIFLVFSKDFSQTNPETIREKSSKFNKFDFAFRYKNENLEYLIDCSLYDDDNGAGGQIHTYGSFLAELTENGNLIFKVTAKAWENILEIEFNPNCSAQEIKIIETIKYRIAYQKKEDSFWKNDYGAKSFEEKAAYWANGMFRSERWQTESGLDIYEGYTPNWYQFAKKREPDFDKMLVYIFER
ncbi:MAG: hypothetical protein K1X72_19915 [Pyrinomonadaceae bacterium]|nr:hypothetical protein [Pyrinomonadaceae bacterium]